MTTIKPSLTKQKVLTLLQKHFDHPVTHLAPIDNGHIARTFSFRCANTDYIIRFNSDSLGASFAKEAYISQLLAGTAIPIPIIQQRGQFEGVWFAISNKLPGVTSDRLPPPAYDRLTPAIIQTLDTIHQVALPDRPGFGSFDHQGVGMSSSWRDYLSSVIAEEAAGGFYGRWHNLFQQTFLERDRFERIYSYLVQNLAYCPEERYLVHGDYGFNNLLVEDGRITGVLDWGNAKYGDFLYDVAWLDMWAPDIDYQARFAAHYKQLGQAAPHFEERVRCYQAYMGLDAMRFFAKLGDEGAYQWVNNRLAAIFPTNQ